MTLREKKRISLGNPWRACAGAKLIASAKILIPTLAPPLRETQQNEANREFASKGQ